MKRYYIWRRAKDELDRTEMPERYEDTDFEVFRMEARFTPDVKYGIVCKKLDENGVYSFFVADEGQTYYSYSRTDQTFTKDTLLDLY
jgi:hypothetical protein